MKSGFFTISGCSGGGKSSLLSALAARGYDIVAEPGLRLIRSGGPKPWEDMLGFLQRTAALARQDLEQAASLRGAVFFDRGLVDALSGLVKLGDLPAERELPKAIRRYRAVFFAPPWREIFEQNEFRRHDFKSAELESKHLLATLRAHGCEPILLPKFRLDLRCEYLLARIQNL